jgi:hypothetical protein
MKVLTVKAPLAWAIFHSECLILSMRVATPYRGPLAIHTAKICSKIDYNSIKSLVNRSIESQAARKDGLSSHLELPELKNLPRGFVYGVVDLVDCRYSRNCVGIWGSPEHFHWKLANPRLVKQKYFVGQLGIWNIPDEDISFDTSQNPLALESGYKQKGCPKGEWIVRVYPHDVLLDKYSFSLTFNGFPMVDENGSLKHGAYATVQEAMLSGVATV